jgi:hypothetical protein
MIFHIVPMKPTSSSRFTDWLTPSQRSTIASGDVTAIRAADDAALAEAILASLAEEETQTMQYNKVTDEDLIAQAKRDSLPYHDARPASTPPIASLIEVRRPSTSKLSAWPDEHGFDILENGGGATMTAC